MKLLEWTTGFRFGKVAHGRTRSITTPLGEVIQFTPMLVHHRDASPSQASQHEVTRSITTAPPDVDCEQSLFFFGIVGGKWAICDCDTANGKRRSREEQGRKPKESNYFPRACTLVPHGSRLHHSPLAVSQSQIVRFPPLSQRKITTARSLPQVGC